MTVMCPDGMGVNATRACRAMGSLGYFPLGEPIALVLVAFVIYFALVIAVAAIGAAVAHRACSVPFVITFVVLFMFILNAVSCYDRPGCMPKMFLA